MSSLEVEAQIKRLVDALSIAGEDFNRWVNLQVAKHEESLPRFPNGRSVEDVWKAGYAAAMGDAQEKRDQAEPVAWALDKGDGSAPRVPYPGANGAGSRYAVERVIEANPSLGYKAVPLYRMEDL